MLADRWGDSQQSRADEIATRVKHGAPLVDEITGEPIEPLPDYHSVAEYRDIWIRLRALTTEEILTFNMRWRPLAIQPKDDEGLKQTSDAIKAGRDFIARGVVEVVGLEDEAGPFTIKTDGENLTDAQVRALAGCGDAFLYCLIGVVRAYQTLGTAEKKTFGGPRASISPGTGAQLAPSPNGARLDAMAEPSPFGLQGPNTSTTDAPAA